MRPDCSSLKPLELCASTTDVVYEKPKPKTTKEMRRQPRMTAPPRTSSRKREWGTNVVVTVLGLLGFWTCSQLGGRQWERHYVSACTRLVHSTCKARALLVISEQKDLLAFALRHYKKSPGGAVFFAIR